MGFERISHPPYFKNSMVPSKTQYCLLLIDEHLDFSSEGYQLFEVGHLKSAWVPPGASWCLLDASWEPPVCLQVPPGASRVPPRCNLGEAKKTRTVRTVRTARFLRRNLYYVSENEGFSFRIPDASQKASGEPPACNWQGGRRQGRSLRISLCCRQDITALAVNRKASGTRGNSFFVPEGPVLANSKSSIKATERID